MLILFDLHVSRHASGSHVPLYRVTGQLPCSRNCKGIRQEVYRQASTFAALYGLGNEQQNINYGDSYPNGYGFPAADLHFNLLFHSNEKSKQFVNAIEQFFAFHQLNHLVNDSRIEASNIPEVVYLKYVLSLMCASRTTHDANRSKSTANSMNGLQIVTL